MGKASGTGGRAGKGSHNTLSTKSTRAKEAEMFQIAYWEASELERIHPPYEHGAEEKKAYQEGMEKLKEKYGSFGAKGRPYDYERYKENPVAPTQMTEAQAAQFTKYAQDRIYAKVQADLRRKGTTDKIDLEVFDSAFKPLKKDLVVYRGANGAHETSGQSRTYISTTTDPSVARRFSNAHRSAKNDTSIVTAMVIPKGTRVLVTGSTEREVIIARGTDTTGWRKKVVLDRSKNLYYK